MEYVFKGSGVLSSLGRAGGQAGIWVDGQAAGW